ncbi:hypothetical protein [Bacillus sp. NEB1478]|uniref:hypothetical protein n=1 Tax=Bacillus sp. NEB1478 TaxID=3073816 RepID=UPI00287375B9|nr:hypothetical protein [Bacillus sp. NEB1478]WNB93413.1 hypothetical protein RGB74_07015 [Bacillus sp. NEB1478]
MFTDTFASFIQEIDETIVSKKDTLTCHEIFETQERIKGLLGEFAQSKANFTGFTEMLVYRFLYHHCVPSGAVIHAGKRYDGKRMQAKNSSKVKTQSPDITIETAGKIQYLFSIKANPGGAKAELDDVNSPIVKKLLGAIDINDTIPVSVQDINRIENLYEKQGDFRALTIYYSTPSVENERMLNKIQIEFPWYNYLVLNNNHDFLCRQLNFLMSKNEIKK